MAVDALALHNALLDAGIPVVSVSVNLEEQITVTYSRALTGPEQTLADSIIADPYFQSHHKPRTLYAIYSDISALSGTEKVAIWNDINSGSPKKYFLNKGPNTAAIITLDWAVQSSGTSPTSIQQAQLRLLAMYTQDNPRYLVNPTFAPTVNVPGDQPVTN